MAIFFLIVLLVMMAGALSSGYPVIFAIPGSAILTMAIAALSGSVLAGDAGAYFANGGPLVWLSTGVTNARGVYWDDESDILIAIPLFVFMGVMFQKSKIADDLLVAMSQLLRPVPGSMAVSVIFVGALLAATSGVVGATVAVIGVISLPAMLRNNYSKAFASGTIAATGTLAQIIPPSIILLILVEQLTSAVAKANGDRLAMYKDASGAFPMPTAFDVISVNAGDMFLGAIWPGLILVGLYLLYVFGIALWCPRLAPKPVQEGEYDWRLAQRALRALLPPLVLIFLVLGSLFTGVATANQAGAIGAAGATIMAGYRLCQGQRGAWTPAVMAVLAVLALAVLLAFFSPSLRRLQSNADLLAASAAALAMALLIGALCWSGWRTLKIDQTLSAVVTDTARTTSIIFAILLGAVMFTAAFRAFGGDTQVKDFLQGLPGGFWAQFAVVMLVMFVLGFYLDFVQITAVVVPIVAPVLLADPAANITAVWLGVMICLIMQTSFLTPPFGFALFYLRAVAPPGVKTIHIYKGVVPFVVAQLIALVIVGAYPQLVNSLPNRVLFASGSAPPLTSPRLQYCLDQYVSEQYQRRGKDIEAAITTASALDLRILPARYRDALAGSFENARSVGASLAAIHATEAAIAAAAPGYRPRLAEVRRRQREARRLAREVAVQKATLARGVSAGDGRLERVRMRIATISAQRQELLAGIGPDWSDAHKAMAVKLQADTRARRDYRRKADGAYGPLVEVLAAAGAVARLKALAGELRALAAITQSQDPAIIVPRLKSAMAAFARVPGTSRLGQSLRRARRALRPRVTDVAQAQAMIATALVEFDVEVAWRERATRELVPKLKAYEAVIADNIGLRGQSGIPRSAAADIARCSATPRDIELYF